MMADPESFCRKQRGLHSVTRRAHQSRLPATEEERRAPLHVSSVAEMDVEALRARMTATVRRRFDEVWRLTFPDAPPPGTSTPSPSEGRSRPSHLQHKHAELLVENGVAGPASGPGPSLCVPFTVMEEKPSGLRQRFILWTKQANDNLEESYAAHVPLGHISGYLDAVFAECGSARDFKCGFYQIPIPAPARRFFRFADESGDWYELLRLPMGHCCAPELMHTLAAVVGGHRDYVRQEFCTAPEVGVDVWIDNVRLTGPRTSVEEATRQMDKVAAACAATWKPSDSVDTATVYEFLGVAFDHAAQTVSPSDRLMAKLDSVDWQRVTAGELESLGGRLLHASAISGVSPGRFWFGIKFLRRVTNFLNRAVLRPPDPVRIPPSVCRELRQWCVCVGVARVPPHRRVIQSTPPSFTCFVDASLKGWGGVLIDSFTQEMQVIGDSWTAAESQLHINILEAMALNKTVRALPRSVCGGAVEIWVDNTTVAAVVRKRLCAACNLINKSVLEAVEYLTALQVLSFSVGYVHTSANPADLPSRIPPSCISSPETRDQVSLAVRRFFTRGGAGGDLASTA